ncbi:excisionase [Allopusillimonas ginsengisoli]|nr:excisionase [Allopusillimonas ginsengisoli]
MNFVTVRRFSELSGYSEDAIRSKVRDRIWAENEVWKKAPDGRILINIQGYESWVQTDGVLPRPQTAAYKSRFNTGASAAGRRLSSSPPPLT